MCGIFGIVSTAPIRKDELNSLAKHAQQRGKDASGLVFVHKHTYQVHRRDTAITQLLKVLRPYATTMAMGHSSLIDNGLGDNQPLVRDGICVIHEGLILNHEVLWQELGKQSNLHNPSEVIAAIISDGLDKEMPLEDIPAHVLALCEGIVACAVAIPALGKLLLFSNNGSLYLGKKGTTAYFATERYALELIACEAVEQVMEAVIIDIEVSDQSMVVRDQVSAKTKLITELQLLSSEEKLLEYPQPIFRRCTKCILPDTMPFINFDEEGVCNYCRTYQLRNVPRPKKELFDLVEPYRRKQGIDCVLPFSGGRDSCYGLHLIVKELKMKPVTYTYDWGMVTDLGKRNISRMCAALGVENITVVDDIAKKGRTSERTYKLG